MKKMEEIDDFCLRLCGIVTNIRVLGETMEESYVVKKFLRAVPSKYLQIVSTIEQFGNLEEMTVEETIGQLKAHEERIRGPTETSRNQLLLTETEWMKREAQGGQLFLTRGEWLKKTSPNQRGGRDSEYRQKIGYRGSRDKSKIRCFNCKVLGHYASECRKARRGREQKQEANLT